MEITDVGETLVDRRESEIGDIVEVAQSFEDGDTDLLARHLGPFAPERLLDLQRERTRLVGTLAQVRYAETLADDSL